MPVEDAELAAIRASFDYRELKEAARAQQEGRSESAKAIADQFLRNHPDDLLALTIAAEASLTLGDLDIAEEMLRKVLDRSPSFLRASMLLAKCLATQLRLGDAIGVIEKAVERDPANRMVLRFLAQLRADSGSLQPTTDIYRQLLAADDADPGDWVTYAQFLRIHGHNVESQSAFRHALTLDPGRGAAWWGLAYYFPFDLNDRDVDAISKALAEASPGDAGLLHIALSIVAERRGDYETAMREITAGKRLRAGSEPYDPDFLTERVDQAIADFTPELYAAKGSAGSQDPSLIFIVGMPRSGSTLTERILGQHSMIEPMGELQIMPRLVEGLRRRAGPESGYSALVASMSPDELTELGEWYLERSREFRRSEKPYFVDKSNVNWLHSGLIRLILPNAKILDVRRDAIDCCWSNYKLLFGDGYANDLRHVARFYRDYVRMMDHADAAAPGAILRVRYEDVVNNIEATTRRMLDFIGLGYEPDCINFHQSSEPVATPSSEQVRRPLNREGIGAWKPYERWLQPLIEELGALARANQ